MHPNRPDASRHPRRAFHGVSPIMAGLWLSLCAPLAAGDIFHLNNGGMVEGQTIFSDERSYTVRTTVGTIVLPASAITGVEPGPTPFDEYDQRVRTSADTPAAHTALAEWCTENGLSGERRKHLQRALTLDGDYLPARTAMGYVRVGASWVDGRSVAERPTPKSEAAPSAESRGNGDEKLAAAVQANWQRRVRAIRLGMLESGAERRIADGRRQILEIRDPLAILPMTRVLAGGNRVCRALLVEALAAFPQDEATLNLAVLALSDTIEDIRSQALADLVRRADTRVGAQFRKALSSDSDELIRRAAVGLAAVRAVEAVPDLIGELTVRRTKRVEVPVRTYFGEMSRTFSSPTEWSLNGSTQIVHAPQVGLFDPASGVSLENVFRVQRVTVYRTEVLEALKLLTGQNFGFDATAWRTWYEEHR